MTSLLSDSVPMNQHVKHRCSRSAQGKVLFTFGAGGDIQHNKSTWLMPGGAAKQEEAYSAETARGKCGMKAFMDSITAGERRWSCPRCSASL